MDDSLDSLLTLSEAATVAPPTPPRTTTPTKKSPGRQKRKAPSSSSAQASYVDPTVLPVDTSDAEAVSIATQAAEAAKRYSREANEFARTTRQLQQVQSRVASSADLVLSSATLDQAQRSTLLTLAASLTAAAAGSQQSTSSASQAASSQPATSQASQSSSQPDGPASSQSESLSASSSSSQLALSASAPDFDGVDGDGSSADQDGDAAGGYRALVEGRKRRCHCKNSRCLKLYCECFTAGVYCSSCSCNCCQNNEMHEELVSRAINETLERNADAFLQPSVPLPQDVEPPTAAAGATTQSARHLSSLSVTRQLTGDQRLRSLARELLADVETASSATSTAASFSATERAVLTSLAEYLEKGVARLERISATPGSFS